jgi:hypothetical protein
MEMHQEGESIPTKESLMNYRSQGEYDLFELWCDTFFRPGYGTAEFRDRAKKKHLSDILTVFDEAFIVATIENNYERWMKEAELLSQGKTVDKKKLPRQKYTNDAAASKKYQGWSTEGLEFFNKTVNDLIQLRNTSASKSLEKKYLDKQVNRDMQAKKTRKGVSLPETQAVDGLQAYLKNFFPNLVNRNDGSTAGSGLSNTTETGVSLDRPDKRQRISLTPERRRDDEEEYESDVDNPNIYDGYDGSRVGQTGEV